MNLYTTQDAFEPAAGRIINIGITVLYKVWGFNSSILGPQYIHIYDSISLPIAGQNPLLVIPAPANNIFLAVNFDGIVFNNGIVIALSDLPLEFNSSAETLWAGIMYDV